jgi:hypothetical protein
MTDKATRRRHDTCGSTTKAGGQCRRPAGWGTPHPGVGSCKMHFGNSANGITAAAREELDRDLRGLLAKLGEPEPVENPLLRLRTLAGEIDQWLDVCRAKVRTLDGEFTIETFAQGEQIRAIVREYTLALERAQKAHADIVRLNIDDRLVRVQEAHMVMLAAAVGVMLARAIPAEFHERARDVLEAELRRLDAGGINNGGPG